MRKIVEITLVLTLMVGLAGCEAIQRKFTRRKKVEAVRPVFYQEGRVETRPNLELYMMHYMYWKTWQEELIVKAGENAKRDAMACNQIVNNLMDMKRYLVEEKAEELDIYLQQLKKIMDEIKIGKTTSMRLGFLKEKLDDIKGRIVRKFYYKKIREYIKPD